MEQNQVKIYELLIIYGYCTNLKVSSSKGGFKVSIKEPRALYSTGNIAIVFFLHFPTTHFPPPDLSCLSFPHRLAFTTKVGLTTHHLCRAQGACKPSRWAVTLMDVHSLGKVCSVLLSKIATAARLARDQSVLPCRGSDTVMSHPI